MEITRYEQRKALLIQHTQRGHQRAGLSWENGPSSASKWPHPAGLWCPHPTLHLSLTSSAWPAPQLRDMEAIIAAGTGTYRVKSNLSNLRKSKLCLCVSTPGYWSVVQEAVRKTCVMKRKTPTFYECLVPENEIWIWLKERRFCTWRSEYYSACDNSGIMSSVDLGEPYKVW